MIFTEEKNTSLQILTRAYYDYQRERIAIDGQLGLKKDGTPKRTVGVFYEDIMAVWSRDMDEEDFAHMREGVKSNPLAALTDKQFTAST
jgi:hypothetical protein